MTRTTTDRELVFLGAVCALLLSLLAGVETAGLVGGLFATGHPVLLPLPSAATTLVRLAGHLGSSAWPPHDQPWLPETMAPALALGGLVALVLSNAAVLVLRRLAHTALGDGARFARAGDVRQLHARGGLANGIPLGRHRGRELFGEPNASVVLCGPSQVGKSLAAVVRAILNWNGCLIVLSIKEELLRYTLQAREQRGEVKIFDPTGQTGYRTHAWSPVAASGTWTQARAIAAGLLQIGQEADRYDREPHWRRTAARYLAPLLLAANQTGQSMRTVVSWIDLFERDELRKILNASPDPEAIHALENLESLWKTDHRYQGSVIGTLSTALDAWQEPAVARATTLADISPRWLCDGSNTLYIVSPASQQRRLQNLFGGLLVHMIDGALEFAQQASRGRLDPPLLCALDEICNAAPLPTLGEYASSGAGQGVLLLSVIQDYSQAIDAWGRERAATIVSNHRGKLFWSGIADPATFEYIDRLLGQEERERESRTRQAYGGTSTTRAFEFRPLAPPHRLRQAKFGTALLVYGQLPPVWTEQRLFTEDPRLRQLVPEDAVQARNLGSGPRRRSALWRRVDGNVT
jgi:type IV secretion system protein VirD4